MKSTSVVLRLMLAVSFAAVLMLSVSASANSFTFTANMTGSQEVPPNGSPATGQATVTLDTVAQTLFVSETFSGLFGGLAAFAHIHCCALPGVNAVVAIPFPGFPPATSGIYSQNFDLTLLSTYNSSFITANGGTVASAEAALIAGLTSGLAYVNIHDATFPGGEIRGQLVVPEPSSLILLGSGLAGLGVLRRRKNRS